MAIEPKKYYFPIPEEFKDFTEEERKAYALELWKFMVEKHLGGGDSE